MVETSHIGSLLAGSLPDKDVSPLAMRWNPRLAEVRAGQPAAKRRRPRKARRAVSGPSNAHH